jgi:nucleoside-diphosphate-sugar epimerase
MGYVGSVLVPALRQQFPAAGLHGFDIGFFSGILTSNSPLPETFLNHQVFGDVRTAGRALFNKIDHVIYLAAISNDPMGDRFSEATYAINRDCAVRLAALARESGVSTFTFASSCSVYGAGGSEARTEDSPLGPLTAYAKSKVDAERQLETLADDTFKITCLRFATACGSSPRLRLDLVLNDFVASAIATREIKVLSDGSPWRPLIDVHDMARAMAWAVNDRSHLPGAFLTLNTGSNAWNFQIKDLAHAVGDILQNVQVSINTEASPDNRSYQVDFRKYAELAPNHRPAHSLESTVNELVAQLKGLSFTDVDFRQSHLMRLVALDTLVAGGQLDQQLRPAHQPLVNV